MNQAQVNLGGSFVADDQPSKVLEPSVGPLHDPAPDIPSQGAPVLRRRLLAVAPMRTDQFDAPVGKSLRQRVAVVSLVGDHLARAGTRTTWTETADIDGFERDLREIDDPDTYDNAVIINGGAQSPPVFTRRAW